MKSWLEVDADGREYLVRSGTGIVTGRLAADSLTGNRFIQTSCASTSPVTHRPVAHEPSVIPLTRACCATP